MANLSPQELAAQLRTSALNVYPAQLINSGAHRDALALGVLMETGYEKAVATLVCWITGDASIYFSSGGGIIGGQGHADVRIAAKRFTQFAAIHISEMIKCSEFPLPKFGETTFYVTTGNGVFTVTAPEKVLGAGSHDFSPLFQLGHYVITVLRKTTEGK